MEKAKIIKNGNVNLEPINSGNVLVSGQFSPAVAKCLIEIRKALLEEDINEAWYWLYQIASPNFDKLSVELDEWWTELEKVAGENLR